MVNFLIDIYNTAAINAILDFAIDGKCDIYFSNQLTSLPQALTPVQLFGIKKFRGVIILLETGQTYQIGLALPESKKATYQEVYFADLMVDEINLARIEDEFVGKRK